MVSNYIATAIAFAVLIVAFMQWRTAHQRVVLDLFDRRLEVFSAVRAMYREINLHGEKLPMHVVTEFHQVRIVARFLFGDDVNQWLKQWHEALIDMSGHFDGMRSSIGPDRSEHLGNGMAGLRQVMLMRHESSVVFAPYMKMDQKIVRTPWQWFLDRNEIRKSYGDPPSQNEAK